MDNDPIEPGLLINQHEGDEREEIPTDNFREIYYRMEVSRRVEDFRRSVHAGREKLIVEISQLIIYKEYMNELIGANQSSLDLLCQQNKLAEFRLPKSQPLSPARRTAEMATQVAILQEHSQKREKITELCHTLALKLDELVSSRSSPDLVPACKLVLQEFNETFKSQLSSCQVISAEIRAIKNLVCTELDPTTETLDEFNARFTVLKAERSLQDQPKVKAMVMSANVKRELGFLANNAGSYKNIFCLKSPKFTKFTIS